MRVNQVTQSFLLSAAMRVVALLPIVLQLPAILAAPATDDQFLLGNLVRHSDLASTVFHQIDKGIHQEINDGMVLA
jgi:hypothetical protein